MSAPFWIVAALAVVLWSGDAEAAELQQAKINSPAAIAVLTTEGCPGKRNAALLPTTLPRQ
jgi:hypothetical protein